MEVIKSRPDHGALQASASLRLPQKISGRADFLEDIEAEPLRVWLLIRKYLLLGLTLVLAGTLGGIGMVLLQTPIYKSRILLEVQPLSATVSQNVMDPFAAMFNMDNTNIQTQVHLLDSGPFRARVFEQMRQTPPPPPPAPRDMFGRLRMLIRPSATREAVSQRNALAMAAGTFSVSIINDTRLLELSCESTHPVITSAFLNNIAQAFIDDAIRSKGAASEMTNAWLKRHIDETKSSLQDADARLRTFVLKSGNVFASSDATVDDVKLKDLQTQLATAEVDKLAKQAAYEAAMKNQSVENVPQVVNDPIASTIRSQIAELDRQKAVLLINLTPKNPKVIAIEDQQKNLEASLRRQASGIVARLKSEYDASVNHEGLLLKAYAEESGQVTSQASKAAEYSALRREVDELQKRYDSLLAELSRTQVAQSAPVIPLRLVEPSVPPTMPTKPQPKTQMLLGVLGGLAATFGIAFIREKMDRSLASPEALQAFVRVPQLGVIPAAHRLPRWPDGRLLDGDSNVRLLPSAEETTVSGVDSGHVARTAWEHGSIPLADSFRATVASITRNLGSSRESRIILITSSTPGAGKTTVVSNLGIALSEAGKRTVIVDADFRRPHLSRVFGCRSDISLPAILLSDKPVETYQLEELTLQTSFASLRILPTYESSRKIATMLYSDRLPRVLEKLRSFFDVVLVDVPPILFPADARVIAEYTHGAVLVVRAGHCERDGLRAAVKCLYEDGVPILGTVLNGWVPSGAKSGMRYYNYYYSDQYKEKDSTAG
ncbi:MAG: polysaccharide biosynthesis tyrosine autokinase [Acidobacteriaceae bacterium]|nr:polysaccharide biosynthesis tyrosine autokinase [Acidobacteriaceae bacterium]MBV8572708.1 polysaccharide biosynthesis tyrosine autokinase [Acidobacteriaceae bacterium]